MTKIPWWTPHMTGGELDLVSGVLDSNYINDGEVTASFETEIARRLGVKHAVAVTSGTAAITAALHASGVRAGDEVIVPDITFIATANAASILGAKVVLADVEELTLNIDPISVERLVTSRTKAIVPVHVSGRGANMAALLEIAQPRNIAVVEDAAEGFLSKKDGRYLGTTGIAGCFSFSPNKTVTTGQGGVVVTDDHAFYRKLRELKDQGRREPGTGGDDLHYSAGYNFKFTNLHAAVGLAQLAATDERMERMRSIYRIYAQRLSGVPGLRLPGFDIDAGECPQWTDAVVELRDDFDRHLAARDIHCRRFWFPLHTQAPYRLPAKGFPASARVGPKALWLPSSFLMCDADAHRVCDEIEMFAGAAAGFLSAPGGVLDRTGR
jgi:perosamine synthetase